MKFIKKKYPFFFQLERMDCGPTCLRMIAAYYGKRLHLNYLRECCHIGMNGVSMQGLVAGGTRIGFKSLVIKIPFASSTGNNISDVPLPAIAYWGQNHYVVVYKRTPTHFLIGDPAQGNIKVSHEQFLSKWANDSNNEGVILLLQPTEDFYKKKTQNFQTSNERSSFAFLLKYLKGYRKYIALVFLTILISSLIQYIFPYFTKSIIDVGIAQKKIDFIYLVLFLQLALYSGQTVISFLQSWIVLHLSTRINILFSSDFLYKLTRLPIAFYDNKYYGEIIQRINDHRKVEAFFSATTLNTLFSFVSLFVFGLILFKYNQLICLIYFAGTAIYLFWVYLFISKRKRIDYELFNQSAMNHELLYEFIYGMQEIKMQNSERKRSLQWTSAQSNLLKINLKSARLIQVQEGGAFFINQFKDILITILGATLVIDGQITLGMLLAIQLIIGLLSSPVQQMVAFIRNSQDVKLCLDRIVEVHNKPEENYYDGKIITANEVVSANLQFKDVSFKYNILEKEVLSNISLIIPTGKITAIVGASGSGKTTMIKLMLGFYSPTEGSININGEDLTNINPESLRRHCGAVMQDGYIFSDTIANNITECDDVPDWDKLNGAIEVANISEYINSLALKHNTLIGSKGSGLSQGQKQRLLIARSVYKNPQILFFDEATNALDSVNEKIIMENLNKFYSGRTVVIVAHRLSTVKNADQIVVLENGTIAEQGQHNELVKRRGLYYDLIKNQLELGN